MPVTRTTPRSNVRRSACWGTASVEAVVVLPVFIIIFVSVFYVRSQVLSRQAAETKARTCAWAYSMINCEDAYPPGCEVVLQPGNGAGRVTDTVGNAISGVASDRAGPVITNVLQPAIDTVFGSSLDARTKQSYQRPALYGGGTATSSGSYHLACNLKTETLPEVAQDAWNSLFKF